MCFFMFFSFLKMIRLTSFKTSHGNRYRNTTMGSQRRALTPPSPSLADNPIPWLISTDISSLVARRSEVDIRRISPPAWQWGKMDLSVFTWCHLLHELKVRSVCGPSESSPLPCAVHAMINCILQGLQAVSYSFLPSVSLSQWLKARIV